MLRAAWIAPSKLLARFGRLPSPVAVVCQLSESAKLTWVPKIEMTAKENARPLEVGADRQWGLVQRSNRHGWGVRRSFQASRVIVSSGHMDASSLYV